MDESLFDRSRWALLVSTLCFGTGAAGGLLSALLYSTAPGSDGGDLSAGGQLPGMEFYFVNNATVGVMMTLGALSFGVFTVVLLLWNGAFIASVVHQSFENGYLLESVLLISPHAAVEIPAILLAGAAGLRLPVAVLYYLTGRRSDIVTRRDCLDAGTLAVASLALLAVAAFIEAEITPWLAEQYLSA